MIKAEVTYTTDHFKAGIGSLALFKDKWHYIFRTIVITMLIGYVVYKKDFHLGWVSTLVFSAYFGVTAYTLIMSFILAPKRQMREYQEKYGDKVIHFEFTEDQFIAKTDSGEDENVQSFGYDLVESVTEDSSFFNIRVKNAGIFVIREDELTEGTPDELRAFLGNKLGDKFRQQ